MNEHRQSLFRRNYGNTSCFCFHHVAPNPRQKRDGLQTPFPDVACGHERVLQQVSRHVHPLCPGGVGSSTHVHLPSLGQRVQDTCPPPVPGGSGSGHTSTSCPWERGCTQQRSCTELAQKTWTQPLKDKATGPHSFILSTNH